MSDTVEISPRDRPTTDECAASEMLLVALVPKEYPNSVQQLEAVLRNLDSLTVGNGVDRPEDRRLLFRPDGDQEVVHPRFKIEIFDDGVRFATDCVHIKLSHEDCRKLRVWHG